MLQGEGGTVDTLLSQVGDLSTSLANRDQLIGDVINNLNSVLGPIDQRDQQLGKLVGNLQTFISGLSNDRQQIGNSLTNINALAGTTADLLTKARPSLKVDVSQLRQLVGKLDTTDARNYLNNFVKNTPDKLRNIAPAAGLRLGLQRVPVCGLVRPAERVDDEELHEHRAEVQLMPSPVQSSTSRRSAR